MKHPVHGSILTSLTLNLMSQFTSNYVIRTLTPSTFGGKHVIVFLIVVGV